LWKRLTWQLPEDEMQMCWWIANLEEEDKTKEAKMLCRSLSCMRMELCKARLATSQKLRNEWDKRLENNSIAVDRIQENRELWLQAGGPDPDALQTPTEILLAEANRTVEVLNLMLEKHGPVGGLDSFVETLQSAVKMLKVVGWSAIKADRFSLTSPGMYDALVRNAQHLLSSWSGDYTRRQARLREPLEEDGEEKEERPAAAAAEGDDENLREKDRFNLVRGLGHAISPPHILREPG
jgi:hypothetical protein